MAAPHRLACAASSAASRRLRRGYLGVLDVVAEAPAGPVRGLRNPDRRDRPVVLPRRRPGLLPVGGRRPDAPARQRAAPARASRIPGAIFSAVEDEIRRVVDAEDLDVIIDNIGIPPSTNLAYSDNVTISSADGEILVSLKAEPQDQHARVRPQAARDAAAQVSRLHASTSSRAT